MSHHWLIKSEGECYSIDDLARDGRTDWTGIRNYQASNYLRSMQPGDLALFYHSMGDPSGVYGVARVASAAHADPTARDPKDEHYDPRREWASVEMAYVRKLTRPVSLDEIKKDPNLRAMLVARPGQRLSVMPVDAKHFESVVEMGLENKKGACCSMLPC